MKSPLQQELKKTKEVFDALPRQVFISNAKHYPKTQANL